MPTKSRQTGKRKVMMAKPAEEEQLRFDWGIPLTEEEFQKE